MKTQEEKTVAGDKTLTRFAWLMLFVCLTGCQGSLMGLGGRTVAQEERIPLAQQGTDKGSWQARDLTVHYDVVRNGTELKLSGKVAFADLIRYNFSILDYFHLDVIVADSQGKVLDMSGLVTRSNSDPNDPEQFDRVLAVPATAAFMAFSYRGQAHEGGDKDGGSSSYFWTYPIR